MLRPSRVFAVARYEARGNMTGRQAMRLLGVAAALLLPASWFAMPTRLPLPTSDIAPRPAGTEDFMGPLERPRFPVRGAVPAGLESRLVLVENSPFEVRDESPVVVVAPVMPQPLRDAMESIEGPRRVEVRAEVERVRRPGRSLLLAVIAISLLTGPLADALPGERARRTLEVLLSAGITRGEMLGGKWLAWTAWATATTALPAAIAVARGLQEVGWWIAGIPLFVGSTTAFGIWLVRLVDDVVGASAAPMRVFPVVAGGLTILAILVEKVSPVGAAAVPLGGALMVAGDLLQSPAQALAATLGSTAFVVAVLARTGADLDHLDAVGERSRYGALGLSAVATLMWGLTIAGPAVWNTGFSTDLITPLDLSLPIGGVTLLACAAIAVAREAGRGPLPAAGSAASSPAAAAIAALLVGGLLAASGPLPVVELGAAPAAAVDMVTRLRDAAVPSAFLLSPATAAGALLGIVGQVVMYRGVLAPSIGWGWAALLWAFAAAPVAPWTALGASVALGALGARFGANAALGAQVAWAAGAGLLAGGIAGGDATAFALQAVAAAVSLAAWKTGRAAPSRHQS